MKHLAIAAASAAAIAVAVVACSYDDNLLSGGTTAHSGHVATSTNFESQPDVKVVAAYELVPVAQAVPPTGIRTAALDDPAMDDEVCGDLPASGEAKTANAAQAATLAEFGTDVDAAGTPVRLTGVCGTAVEGPLGMRGLSDGGLDANLDGIQIAENHMPTSQRGMPERYVPRRPEALGSGEAAFDLLQSDATPPSSSSVKTSSDYRN